jgi:hypothetical protein
MRAGLDHEQVAGPVLLAALEEREDERVLGWEVAVERRLGHAGVLDHLLDAHAANAAPREQLIRGVQQPLARATVHAAVRLPLLQPPLHHGPTVALDRTV